MKKLTVFASLAMLKSVFAYNIQAGMQQAQGSHRDAAVATTIDHFKNELLSQIRAGNDNAAIVMVNDFGKLGAENTPEKGDAWGEALSEAIEADNPVVVSAILQQTHMPLADSFLGDSWNYLNDALAGGKFNAAKGMLFYLKKILQEKEKPEWLKAMKGYERIYQIFSGDTDTRGETPLMHAVKGDNEQVVESILNTLFTDDVLTALNKYSPNMNLVKNIVNAQNYQGQTALHLAVSSVDPKLKIVTELLDRGADVKQKDHSGHTPIDLAKQRIEGLKADYQAWERQQRKRKRFYRAPKDPEKEQKIAQWEAVIEKLGSESSRKKQRVD